MRARQTLSHHVVACTQHRRHAEHSPKACMVQQANEQGTPRDKAGVPSCARRVERAASVAGESAHAANDAIGPYTRVQCMLV